MLADTRVEHVARGVLVRLPIAVATSLFELIVAEQQCCPFLGFEIGLTVSELRLTITADDEAYTFIDDLIGVEQARRA